MDMEPAEQETPNLVPKGQNCEKCSHDPVLTF